MACTIPAIGVLPPFFTFVAVLAMAPVAGIPPNNADAILPTPCPINSILERCLLPIIPSDITQDSKDSITYGPKAGDYTYDWLTYDENDATESLTVTLVLTLENYASLKSSQEATTISDISIAFAWEEAQMTEYIAARDTDKVVGALPTANALTLASFSDADEDGVYTATVTFTFAWGEAFGGKNPMEYYNNQEFTNDLATEATENLTKLYALNAAGFKLNLTGSVH